VTIETLVSIQAFSNTIPLFQLLGGKSTINKVVNASHLKAMMSLKTKLTGKL
jgi:hypothetical protein